MNICMSVYSPRPITGQLVIECFDEAVSQLKLEPCKEINYTADLEAFRLVAKVPYSTFAVAVKVGFQFSLEAVAPTCRYISFAISNTETRGGGIVKAVRTRDEDLVDLVKNFRQKMIEILASKLGVSVEAILENSRRYAGSGISEIRLVCDHCGTGFTHNPGSCTNCGAPTGKIIPVY